MADNAQHTGFPGLPPTGGEAPDRMHALLQALQDNIKVVVAVAVVVVLAAAAWSGYDYFQKRKMQAAVNDLGALTARTAGADKIQDLERFIAGAPRPYGISGNMELARTAFKAGDYAAAVQAWESLASSGDAALRTVAKLGLARTRMLENLPGEALALLEQVQQSAPKAFARIVLKEIAVAAEAAGNTDRALTAYQELLSNEQSDRAYIEHRMKQILLKAMNKG